MRGLQTTMFVLLLIVLTTQTFRHVYVKWIEPTGSVLDEFRPPVEQDIAQTESLDALKAQYAQAYEARAAYEKSARLSEVDMARRTDQDVYQRERELREAIERVEAQDRTRFQLWFYWLFGVASVLLGLLAYAHVSRWVGCVGMITGFVEMAVWTSPLWRSWGPQNRFDELLVLKLALSIVSMVLLLALWLWRERLERRAALTAPRA